MEIRYGINATPKEMGWGKFIACCFQQMLAIMAATILVPMLVNGYGIALSPAAALAGAGVGTLVYQLFVRRQSPVFLGSSFAFLGAYEAAAGAKYGFWGLIIGVLFAGLVYVVIALVIKGTGTGWVNKLMQPVIIGPTVALIGLSLSGSAVSQATANGATYNLFSIVVALVTFFIIILCSSKGTKTMKLIPFIIGIAGGYVLALILTLIGNIANVPSMQLLSFGAFEQVFSGTFKFSMILDFPKFTIIEAFKEGWLLDGAAISNLALMFAPIAFVVFAEHIADHKNLSSIIGHDLITDPGLTRTLLGDGIGSIAGAIVGGCANTTYGESIGCVAITGNASTWTIIGSAVGCIALSFFTPFVAFINSIPQCVMGGACIALYGFIAVSGLKMLKGVDLNENRNLFVVSAILVTGIGGLTFNFGAVTITNIAAALIVGLLANLALGGFKKEDTTTTTTEKNN